MLIKHNQHSEKTFTESSISEKVVTFSHENLIRITILNKAEMTACFFLSINNKKKINHSRWVLVSTKFASSVNKKSK